MPRNFAGVPFWDTGHDPFVYAFLVRDNNA